MEKGALELHWAATTKSRQIERSVFFYWTMMDKLEFTDWSRVRLMFVCGENASFRWRRMIAPPLHELGLRQIKDLGEL